jgi:dihydroorotate dehydrogenase electron transfer subunit
VSIQQAGEQTPAPFGRRLLQVTANEQVGAYRLLWALDPDAPAPQPGQFAMIAAAQGWGAGVDERPFLPRAFSIARRRDDGQCAFLIEDVGPGTERLCALCPGEGLWMLGPLGCGFAPAPDGHRTILVGGGIGIAPLMILQDAILGAGGPARTSDEAASGAGGDAGEHAGRSGAGTSGDAASCVALLGFRGREQAHGASLLRGPEVATDDGSVGHHGLVTDLLERHLEDEAAAVVRACGPPAMLESVRAICERRGVDAQLALEAGMACGYGACYGCAVPRRGGGYLRVCVDGPVVDAAELEHVS